jgi:hypothetical protein
LGRWRRELRIGLQGGKLGKRAQKRELVAWKGKKGRRIEIGLRVL